MSVSDPIADMFTRIRNINLLGREPVNIPASKMKKAIAKLLKEEGFIKDYKFTKDDKSGVLRIYLKYGPHGERIINKIVRISKPGRRVYRKNDKLGKVLDGLGISIISTPKGLMTDHACRKLKLGGEVIGQVW